jgi:hypothetical protein
MRSALVVWILAGFLSSCSVTMGQTDGDVDGGASGTGGDPSPGCGDGICSLDEDCHTCEPDCGVCEPCNAPACAGASQPPSEPVHAPSFDVDLKTESRAEVEEQLNQRLTADSVGTALVAAFVTGTSIAGEPDWLGPIRSFFYENQTAREALRYRIESSVGPAVDVARSFALPARVQRAGDTPGSTEACGRPRLRVRLARLDVVEEDDDWDNDVVWCVIHSESDVGAEVRVTERTPPLDEGDSRDFTTNEGTVWGIEGPRDPEGRLHVTYRCIEDDSSGSDFTQFVSALQDALDRSAATTGNAWISAAAKAAEIIEKALSLDSDDHLFSASQVLEASSYLDAAPGVSWKVSRAGNNVYSDWHWVLNMEMWGCAEFGTGSL